MFTVAFIVFFLFMCCLPYMIAEMLINIKKDIYPIRAVVIMTIGALDIVYLAFFAMIY